jgi:predicted cupin superfamily sugar epimerase
VSLPDPSERTPAEDAETAADVIERLGMTPIPEEGAWIAEGPRTQELSAATVLLTAAPDGFSAMHRLTVDEGWQWLAGAPAALLRLRRGGSGVLNYIGPEHPQVLVRRQTWMGASTLGEWTLVSCWTAPAFRPEYFELGRRETLVARYPDFAVEVRALVRERPVGRMR